jgi:CheY-like chemotaxis protein
MKLVHEVGMAPLVPASERAAKLGVAHLLPNGFDAFFSRCVVRDPTQRFRDAREVRSAFDAVMGARAGVEPTAPMSRRRPSAEVPGPRRILVIDDDPAVLLLLGHHLNRAGYGALTAGTGEEGIEIAVRELPTLVLLDFMLPDIDGPEVLRRLRANDRTRDIPVILLTATEHAAPIAEAFQAGANDFLMKPVDVRVLAARIEAAITAREKARRATVIAARHERLVADLEEARAEQEVPLSMLPASWNGYWAIGGVAPSGVVGGDLIALYEGSDPGLTTAVVVDVAGHGAGAALVGATVRAALGLLLRRHALVDALAALNEELCSAATPRHACLAAVETRGKEVTIVNAGLPPVCVAREGRVILEVASSGVPPGLLPEQTYAATSFTARTGDRIAVVSDGLVEPFGHADDALPILRDLAAFDPVRWTGREAPAEVATRLRVAFAPLEGAQPDDATLLLIEAGTVH